MSPALLLALQAATVQADRVPPDFDLQDVVDQDKSRFGRKCEGRANEIVVCGRSDPDRYRYKPSAARPEYADSLPRAEIDLGDGTKAGIEMEQVGFKDGNASKRVMIRLKKPF